MKPFSDLLPDFILQTAEANDYAPSGVLYPLSSYENRVYDIGLEGETSLIVKFYRPNRWPLEAIIEEHRVLGRLHEAEVPVICPLPLKDPLKSCATIAKSGAYYYAFYERFRGRHKDEFNSEDLKSLGKCLGQMHNVLEGIPIKHRPWLDVQSYGYDRLRYIQSQEFIEPDLKSSIEHHIKQALHHAERFFDTDFHVIPVHGDCHIGNILWTIDGPRFLDFDDFMIAPAAFDVWMLFSGSASEQAEQKRSFFSGYELYREFDHHSLRMSEAFRTLRMIHHAAWIGERYEEEAFKRAFPFYRERRYWEEFLLNIKEQIGLMIEVS